MEDNFKQVIVVNEALRLPRGKLASQVAHAALAAFLEASPEAQRVWLEQGMPKVVLQAQNLEGLRRLEQQATELGLPHQLIRDAGRTVVEPGSVTCLGIGPARAAEIDRVTGELRLVN